MKINKEFTPITITLETKEDKNMFMNILEAARRKRSEMHMYTYGCDADKLLQEIKYIQEKLQ